MKVRLMTSPALLKGIMESEFLNLVFDICQLANIAQRFPDRGRLLRVRVRLAVAEASGLNTKLTPFVQGRTLLSILRKLVASSSWRC